MKSKSAMWNIHLENLLFFELYKHNNTLRKMHFNLVIHTTSKDMDMPINKPNVINCGWMPFQKHQDSHGYQQEQK